MTPHRARLVREATALREQGLSWSNVAAAMGVSRSYVQGLVLDPDRSAELVRRRSYAGTCACGAPTDGSNGRAKAPEICIACVRRRRRRWTRTAIIDAIQRFANKHGRPPTAGEWVRSNAKEGYPSSGTIYGLRGGRSDAVFTSWAEAVEQAGFPRPHPGRHLPKGTRRWVS